MSTPIDLMDQLITVNVALSGVPVSRAGFGTVMLVSPNAAPVSGLVLTYTSATASTSLAADLGAGVINAAIQAAVLKGFAQSPRPAVIKVGKVPAFTTVPGPSTLATDMAAIVAQDDDFYGVALDVSDYTTVGADEPEIELQANAMAAWCETVDKVFLAKTWDDDVYNGAVSTDLASDIKGSAYENTAVVWSQLVGGPPGTADQPIDMAALCRWLAYDPDTKSAPFSAGLTGITRCQLTATGLDLTAAQIAAAKAKYASVAQLYGSAAAYLDPGLNGAGRQWSEVLSKHWLQARVREDIADQAVALAARGDKFPLSDEGVAICQGILARRLQQGVTAGHFSTFAITSGTTDSTTRTITIGANATVLDSARSFTFNINFL